MMGLYKVPLYIREEEEKHLTVHNHESVST